MTVLFDTFFRIEAIALVLSAAAFFVLRFLKHPVERIRLVQGTFAAIALAAGLFLLPSMPKWSIPVLRAEHATEEHNKDFAAAFPSTEIIAQNLARSEDVPENSDRFPQDFKGGVTSRTESDIAASIVVPPENFVSETSLSVKMFDFRLTILGLFAVGSLFFIVQGIAGILRLRIILAVSTPCNSLDDHPSARLRMSKEICSPLVCGLFRPTIVVPDGMDGDELRYAVAHEQAHLRRGDLATWQLLNMFAPLLWMQPFYWLLLRQLRIDQDFLADAEAVRITGQPEDYAELLLSLARNRVLFTLPVALGMGDRPSLLRRRIEMLLSGKQSLKTRCRPTVFWGTVVLFAAVAPLLGILLRVEFVEKSVAQEKKPISEHETLVEKSSPTQEIPLKAEDRPDVRVYAINKQHRDFPVNDDRSTPEAAVAMNVRSEVEQLPRRMMTPSQTEKERQIILEKVEEIVQSQQATEIIEARIFREKHAMVLAYNLYWKYKPLSVSILKKENDGWSFLTMERLETIEMFAAKFAEAIPRWEREDSGQWVSPDTYRSTHLVVFAAKGDFKPRFLVEIYHKLRPLWIRSNDLSLAHMKTWPENDDLGQKTLVLGICINDPEAVRKVVEKEVPDLFVLRIEALDDKIYKDYTAKISRNINGQVSQENTTQKTKKHVYSSVIDAETNKPMAKVKATLYFAKNGKIETRSMQTGAEGKIVFPLPSELGADMEAGMWILVEKDGYVSEKDGRQAKWTQKLLEEGKEICKTFPLQKAETITGRLVDEQGKPLSGITIAVLRQLVNPFGHEGRRRTESFDLKSDSAGKFRITAAKNEKIVFWAVSDDLAPAFVFPDQKRGDLGDIALKAGIRPEVRVLDKDGKPVSDVWVNISREDGEEYYGISYMSQSARSALTGEDGIARFRPTPEGKYEIRIGERPSEKKYNPSSIERSITWRTDQENEKKTVKGVYAFPTVDFSKSNMETTLQARNTLQVDIQFSDKATDSYREINVSISGNQGEGNSYYSRPITKDMKVDVTVYRSPKITLNVVDEAGKPVKEFYGWAEYADTKTPATIKFDGDKIRIDITPERFYEMTWEWATSKIMMTGMFDVHFEYKNFGKSEEKINHEGILPDRDLRLYVVGKGYEIQSLPIPGMKEGEEKDLTVTLKP